MPEDRINAGLINDAPPGPIIHYFGACQVAIHTGLVGFAGEAPEQRSETRVGPAITIEIETRDQEKDAATPGRLERTACKTDSIIVGAAVLGAVVPPGRPRIRPIYFIKLP